MPTVDSIFGIVIFHIYMSLFESTLLSFCKPQSKFDLPTLCRGSGERNYIYIYMLMYIVIHLRKKLNTVRGEILSNQKKKTYGKPMF